jgi:dihydrofolate reductase
MRVSLIVAVARNGAFGIGMRLPWKLSNDLKRFKQLTHGHHLIMGRKTWETLGGKPLPGRPHVVVTRSRDYHAEGATVVASIEEALALDADDEMFVAGGAELIKAAMPYIDRAYVTFVEGEPEADTYFLDVDWSQWRVIEREDHPADEKNEYPYSFVTYERS